MVLAVGAGVRCLARGAADPLGVSVLPAVAEDLLAADHLVADLLAADLLCPCQFPWELKSIALVRVGCGYSLSDRGPGSHS